MIMIVLCTTTLLLIARPTSGQDLSTVMLQLNIKEGKLDKADMYKNNYDATKLAIKRALNDEPSIDELIANRHKIKHCMWEDSWDQK